jgi:hypothetical protein
MIAARWGVHPHEVLIANGWLDAEDYYRALAAACGTAFKSRLAPAEVAPAAGAGPRRSLASGLLKERARSRRFVLAPEHLRPNALRAMLARLRPNGFSLASPQSVRGEICRQFAETFARGAVEGLVSRHPDRSARERPALWQRLILAVSLIGFCAGLAVAPSSTIWLATLLLVVPFVPVVGLRVFAAYRLLRDRVCAIEPASGRVPDVELPVYTILVPLFREAHMPHRLLHGLTHLDWPAAKLDIKLILKRPTSTPSLRPGRLTFPATWRSSSCRKFTHAPSPRHSTMLCRSPAENIS